MDIRILGGADKTYPLVTSDVLLHYLKKVLFMQEGWMAYIRERMRKMYGNIGFLDKTMVLKRTHITMDSKFLGLITIKF